MNFFLSAGLLFVGLMPPAPGVRLPREVVERSREMGLNRYRAVAKTNPAQVGAAIVQGEKNFPVVLMAYTNVAATYDNGDFQTMLFDGPWNPGTAHDYYTEVSYGKVSLGGQVYGPYTGSQTRENYADNNYGIGDNFSRSAGLLIWEACQQSDPSVDYSEYDNDGDGYVDIFTVIHVGYGAEETDNVADIWSHEFSLSGWASYGGPGVYVTDDPDPARPGSNIKIDVYTINPELSDYSISGKISNIGVFCHEWGHGFGLPDLYITEGQYAGGAGLGYFCLMASGSWAGDKPGSVPVHPCAWCKYLMGWVEPEALERGVLEEVSGAEFPTAAQTPSAWRIFANPGGADWSFTSTGQGEYFLAENRRRTGFDAGLPGDGLLILHVDESRSTNSDLENPLVGIMKASGDPSFLYTSGAGSASDLWSSDTLGFSNSSVPSSRFYDGAPSGASVTAISASADVMTADLAISALLLGRVYSFPNPFNVHERDHVTIVYEPTDEEKTAGIYPEFKVYIYDLSGRRVRILDTKPVEISPYGRAAYWDGNNDYARPVASGLYFYIVETYEDSRVAERSKGMLTLVR